jgi:hypothetical protein
MQSAGRVQCYFLGRRDGAIELCDLPSIDYDEAVAAHPKDWSLEPPAAGKRIIDKRSLPNFPQPQIAAGPPMVERQTGGKPGYRVAR